MAGLAYLFLPVSGLAAYLTSDSARTRFHGTQAIVLGFLWGVALLGASQISSEVTLVCFVLGGLAWLGFMLIASIGKDPRLPGIGRWLQRATETSPRAEEPIEL